MDEKNQQRRITYVNVVQDTESVTFSDGSRLNGHTAAAAIGYVGQTETVMDTEMLGITMAWRYNQKAATDPPGAIGGIMELRFVPAASWVEITAQ